MTEITEFDTPLWYKSIYIDMPDGITYSVPVMVIAEHRARKFAKTFKGDNPFYLSMTKDTLPLFERGDHNIKHWAQTQMNWADVKGKALAMNRKRGYDYQNAWVNGNMTIKGR